MRPRLRDAPAEVRAAVRDVLGEPVRLEQPATAGFTPAIASTVTGVSGRSVFVKAAANEGGLGSLIRTGVQLAPLIGDLAPRLLAASEPEGWVVAVYEHVPGGAVEEWDEPTRRAMIDLLAVIRERLSGPPLPGAIRYADAFASMLGAWRSLARRPGGDPSTVAHLHAVQLPVPIPVELLADLEEEWFEVLGPGEEMQHGDLRRDNIIRSATNGGQRLWVVDWTHVWTGPGWMDLVRLAPDIADSGFNPEELLRRSCWADADPHALNVALAGLAGRAWRDCHLPDLPTLRSMQRRQAVQTLRWLGSRLGVSR